MRTAALLALISLGSVVLADNYDQAYAQKAVYLSEAAFCESTDLEDWKCGAACNEVPGVVQVSRVKDNLLGVFGYVGFNPSDNEIIVSFRGSNNIANWIMNIDFKQCAYKGLSPTI